MSDVLFPELPGLEWDLSSGASSQYYARTTLH